MSRSIVFLVAVCFLLSAAASSAVDPLLADAGSVVELRDAEQVDAEALFAGAEAAIYFPELHQVRVLNAGEIGGQRVRIREAALADFADAIERDFPGFRQERFGPYLMKMPHRSTALPSEEVAANATVLTDSFEGNLSQWTLANNTNGEYNFTVMGCKAHNGTWSADAFRGGTRGMHLACWDPYPAGVTTQITHSTCDAIQGASQAWLDFYLTAEMDDSEGLGVYYPAADGFIYGYRFTGSWSTWYHFVFNLKQWNTVGDLTAQPCPKLIFQFRSDASGTAGAGPFIDDVTIRTEAPAFLRAAIVATPASGTAPLTVTLTPTVTGASGTESYEWRFGDAASSTSTSKNATFTYTGAGEYWPRFRVSDSTGTRAYAHTKIVVSAGSGCSLSCTATAPAGATAGTAASFQATASATGCSGSATYLWSFGDGQVSSQQNPTHAYVAAGTYSWSMTTAVSGTTCLRTGTIAISTASTRTSKRRSVLPPGDTVVASQPVGPSGGTVTGGGVAITVPAGAFGSSSTLSITRSSTSQGSGDLSPTFFVKGLPSTLNADLSLSIDLDTTPTGLGSGEAVYVSFTGAAMNRDLNVRSLPFLIPATVSGRNVKATLPKSAGAGVLASASAGRIASDIYTGDFHREMKVVRKTSLTSDHFNIYFPSSHLSWAQIAIGTLEEAYQRLSAFGFSWGCRASGGFVKIPVYVASLGTGAFDPVGEQNSRLDPCGTGWVFTDFLRLNSDYSSSDPTLRAAIGHELFHFLQEMYVPTTLSDPNRGLWMAEASAVWFETVFVAGSCPGVMSGDYQFAWRGLFNAAGSAVEGDGRRKLQNHGYGAAAVLKYRTDQSSVQNDPFVRTIWDNMKNGSSELDAFQSAVGASVSDYWTRFAKEFFTGIALPGCVGQASSAASATIKDASSLSQTFKFGAYPLSSIAYKFDLMNVSITEKTPLPIMAENLIAGQTVYVYDLKDKKELAQLTKSSNTYTIEDVVAAKGRILVVTFVDRNLPAGSSASTNEVTLTTGSTYKCFATYFVSTMKTPWQGGAEVCTGNCQAYDGSISSIFLGGVKNDVYEATEMFCNPQITCGWGPVKSYNNRMTFKFTNKAAFIENFSLTTSRSSSTVTNESLTVSVPVPRLTSTPTGFEYRLTGAGICGSVSFSGPGVGGGLIYGIVCDASSFFRVSCEAYTPPSK